MPTLNSILAILAHWRLIYFRNMAEYSVNKLS